MNEEELEKIAEKWEKCKKEINELEKKAKRYRDQIEEYMNENEVNYIDTDKFEISRISSSKTTISKKDVPVEIWEEYSKRTKYYIYNVKDKTEKKVKKDKKKKE